MAFARVSARAVVFVFVLSLIGSSASAMGKGGGKASAKNQPLKIVEVFIDFDLWR